MIHCWEDETQYIVKKHGLDSQEYVDSILRGGGTCMLPDGHTGAMNLRPMVKLQFCSGITQRTTGRKPRRLANRYSA